MEPKLLNFILFIFPILIALVIFFIQRSIKKLSYEIILDTSLVTVNSTVREKIKIYYEDNIVTNPNFINVRFLNDGNQPISKLDFEDDIVLKFVDDSKIIQCESSKMYPDNLKLKFTYDENSVIIKPLLLNSREFFDLHLIIDSYDSDFEIIDRINGLRIGKYKEPFFISNSWTHPFIALILFTLWSYYFTPLFQHSNNAVETLNKLANMPVYVLPCIIVYMLILTIPSIYRFFRKRKYQINQK